jgi:hypothetical protein
MLIYVLRWWPSWISDPHKKQKLDVPWMVLYKVSVFRSSRIFNMAVGANNMLLLAEISKILFSEIETNELSEPSDGNSSHGPLVQVN